MKKKFNKSIIHYLYLSGFILSLAFIVSCGDDEGSPASLIPAITSISPESGEPGDLVTITGTNLGDAISLTFGTTVAVISTNTATEIQTTVPEGATTGRITVTTNGGAAISESDFTVIIIGAVTVSEVSRRSATIGETITITGTDMATVSSVSIGGVEATVSSTTDTTVEVVVGEDTPIGRQTFTITNNGGTTSTSEEQLEFFVIRLIDTRFIERFEDTDLADETEQFVDFVGSIDPEEQMIGGKSNDPVVIDGSTDLPPAIDGVFWHMEGYSSTDISGSFAAILQLASQEEGTFADFFGEAVAEDIYFNILVNFGELPEGYAESTEEGDFVFGLRMRFDGDDYELRSNLNSLTEAGFTPNNDGWYDLSIPASQFDDDAAIGTFDFRNMLRHAVVVRRNYGSGLGDEFPLDGMGTDDSAEFWSLSFDNVSISIGGPHSFLR